MIAPLPVAVLAVDVGNRKTDLALVAADGSVLAAARGATASHQAVGLARGLEQLARLATRAAAEAGVSAAVAAGEHAATVAPLAQMGAFCLAGADTPRDVRRLERAIGRLGLAGDVIVRNDADAALRAGAPDGWGVALICGEGFNCLGVSPDGRLRPLPGPRADLRRLGRRPRARACGAGGRPSRP